MELYFNIELGLNKGDSEIKYAVVKKWVIDKNGKPIEIASVTNNLLTDIRAYEVEFIDGRVEVLMANVITENLLA